MEVWKCETHGRGSCCHRLILPVLSGEAIAERSTHWDSGVKVVLVADGGAV